MDRCVGRVVVELIVNVICDRFELDPGWSDTGDRYILKLFRDYVFHSIGVDGTPILDLSHVLTCLNKVSGRIHTSMPNTLVVRPRYSELKFFCFSFLLP